MADDSVANNLVLVEGPTDKDLVEALLKAFKITELKCESIKGMGGLPRKLSELKRDIETKETFGKIGIIFDADDVGVQSRKDEIDKVLKSVFGKAVPSCFHKYILHVNGKGECCTLLRAIKASDSPKADCLNAWAQCVANQSKETIPPKEIDKIWMNLYHTYDCSTVKERKTGAKNCNLKTMLAKGMYDLQHPQLQEIRDFLTELAN